MNELSKFDFERCWTKQRRSEKNLSLKDFRAIDRLGHGGFAFVYLVRWLSNETNFYALKISSKKHLLKKNAHRLIIRERDILQCCDHPNIVRFVNSFQDEANVYLLLEFIDGEDFLRYFERCQRFSDDQTRFYVGQILLALEYLHSCQIVYRDLKPENLIIDRHGYLKLIDFGFAKRIIDSTGTMCGTIQYLSPELVRHERYDFCVDFWALGVVMFEMLVGHSPFDGETDEEIFDEILTKTIDFSTFDVFTSASIEILRGFLNRNRNERFGCSINRTFDLRQHRWFTAHFFSFDQLEKQRIRPFYIPFERKDFSKISLKQMEIRSNVDQIATKIFERF